MTVHTTDTVLAAEMLAIGVRAREAARAKPAAWRLRCSTAWR